MRIKFDAFSDSQVLAGASLGKKALGKLLEFAIEPQSPELCYLDFKGIEVATASFLRESIISFRDIIRNKRSNLYPLVANVSDEIIEELDTVLTARRDALLICSISENNKVSNLKILGELDPKQRLTFDLVVEQGEADASKLMKQHQHEEKIGRTAWNNRLTALVTKGLLIEESRGRAKLYKPLSIYI